MTYAKPEIRTIHSADILEVLGPVTAGSPALNIVDPGGSTGGGLKTNQTGR
jgi:hypothetical protein